jgi:hypothetical protein
MKSTKTIRRFPKNPNEQNVRIYKMSIWALPECAVRNHSNPRSEKTPDFGLWEIQKDRKIGIKKTN